MQTKMTVTVIIKSYLFAVSLNLSKDKDAVKTKVWGSTVQLAQIRQGYFEDRV